MNILEVKNLYKCYKEVIAVDGISFSVPEGICFGLLGPNGAGKSTTLEVIEGLKKATSGEVLYKGMPRTAAFKEEIGIQFQSTALQDRMRVKEALEIFASFYRKTLDLQTIIEMCALQEFLDRDHDKLSGGQRQRLLLALALVNDPELIFLDEPTTGLDPQARKDFWHLVENIKAANKTVILTTHYMDEAETLCDEIVIMNKGKIVTQGSPTSLLQEHYKGVKVIFPRSHESHLNPKHFSWEVMGESLILKTENLEKTMTALMQSHISLQGLQIQSYNLEDLFIDMTGGQLRV